jgi:hypothetical protein
MSKNLQIVQKISKVLGILAKIGFIMSIVGLVCCIVGFVLSMVGGLSQEFAAKVVKEGNVTMKQVAGYCMGGLVICIASVIVTKLHKDYFEMEQAAGTPFTQDSAKAFRTLGIVNLVAPLICTILVEIINSILKIKVDYHVDGSFTTGIVMILLSFVFAYGAELEEKAKS